MGLSCEDDGNMMGTYGKIQWEYFWYIHIWFICFQNAEIYNGTHDGKTQII